MAVCIGSIRVQFKIRLAPAHPSVEFASEPIKDGAADPFVYNLAPVTSCHLTDEREQKADENSLRRGRVPGSKNEGEETS